MKEKLFIIIPTYNENNNQLKKLVKETKEALKEYNHKIVIVDDGSDNDYSEIKTVILKHTVNMGKGFALLTGAEYAIKNWADIIINMDADNQHDPKDIPRLIKELKKGVDIVFGSRQLNKHMPLLFRIGNFGLSRTISLLFGISITDTQSGFRGYKAKVFNKIKWKSKNYSVETEMIIKTAKNKLKYSEILINTIYKDAYKGVTLITGMEIFLNILRWRLKC